MRLTKRKLKLIIEQFLIEEEEADKDKKEKFKETYDLPFIDDSGKEIAKIDLIIKDGEVKIKIKQPDIDEKTYDKNSKETWSILQGVIANLISNNDAEYKKAGTEWLNLTVQNGTQSYKDTRTRFNLQNKLLQDKLKKNV